MYKLIILSVVQSALLVAGQMIAALESGKYDLYIKVTDFKLLKSLSLNFQVVNIYIFDG